MKEIGKVSDSMLENVSGGNNEEIYALQNALGASNLREIMDGLKRHGVTAEISSLEGNVYTDRNTGKELSHEEVLAMLKR